MLTTLARENGRGSLMRNRSSDPYMVAAGVLVALAVIGLTGFVVVELSATTPVVIAAVLTAFAAVLAAIPPIIKALTSGDPKDRLLSRSADGARKQDTRSGQQQLWPGGCSSASK
jgi:uncharacterized membrane protein YdfJ with MMPL/SSD domain